VRRGWMPAAARPQACLHTLPALPAVPTRRLSVSGFLAGRDESASDRQAPGGSPPAHARERACTRCLRCLPDQDTQRVREWERVSECEYEREIKTPCCLRCLPDQPPQIDDFQSLVSWLAETDSPLTGKTWRRFQACTGGGTWLIRNCPPHQDHRRVLGIVLLWGPSRRQVFMSEVPLYVVQP